MKNKMPRGSKLLAWSIFIAGVGLSLYLKDETYFTIAVPSAVGMYASKQWSKDELNK